VSTIESGREILAPRRIADVLLKAATLLVVTGFALWFFVLVRPTQPLSAFVPFQCAFGSAAVLVGHGYSRREWMYVAIGLAVLLLLLLTGLLYFPLAFAECQEWVATGRLRHGSF